jgi:hypothetical protein
MRERLPEQRPSMAFILTQKIPAPLGAGSNLSFGVF